MKQIGYQLCVFLESVDGFLDRLPSYEDGHWYRFGGWGCRMGLHRLWDKLYWEDK